MVFPIFVNALTLFIGSSETNAKQSDQVLKAVVVGVEMDARIQQAEVVVEYDTPYHLGPSVSRSMRTRLALPCRSCSHSKAASSDGNAYD